MKCVKIKPDIRFYIECHGERASCPFTGELEQLCFFRVKSEVFSDYHNTFLFYFTPKLIEEMVTYLYINNTKNYYYETESEQEYIEVKYIVKHDVYYIRMKSYSEISEVYIDKLSFNKLIKNAKEKLQRKGYLPGEIK